MTDIEDPLAQALREVPTKGQCPIELIERRARTIRHRRRATVAGISLVAAVGVALPSLATTLGGPTNDVEPDAAATTDSAPACDSWTSEQQGEFLTLTAVPDQMRLLWTQGAPPPTEGNMVDFGDTEATVTDRIPKDCVIPDAPRADDELAEVRLFDVENNVVTRMISVSGPSPDAPRAYHGHKVIETAVGPLVLSGARYDRQQAVWPAENDAGYWVSWIHGEIGDAELIELAESVTLGMAGWIFRSGPASLTAQSSCRPATLILTPMTPCRPSTSGAGR
ncbi:MAG TPA: hypothetical protein VK895_07355 [Jiangellaceae bacterium]|nr:hypothetical protein [Jiangellaceae bacterium]